MISTQVFVFARYILYWLCYLSSLYPVRLLMGKLEECSSQSSVLKDQSTYASKTCRTGERIYCTGVLRWVIHL